MPQERPDRRTSGKVIGAYQRGESQERIGNKRQAEKIKPDGAYINGRRIRWNSPKALELLQRPPG
jgi:hypothetical protein